MKGKLVIVRVRDKEGKILEEGIELLVQAGIDWGIVSPYPESETRDVADQGEHSDKADDST